MIDPMIGPRRLVLTTQVTVVIPVLNMANTIGHQLDALAGQDFNGQWEVIIADNGSTDAIQQAVESYRDRLPQLRIVDASARRGVNHARNAGARAASGSLILFCDADDVVTSTWVSAMANALGSYDAVGGRLQRVSLDDSADRDRSRAMVVDPVKPDSTFLPHPIGANCGVKRDVWLEMGGFDEDYDGGACDEVEFFWRVQLAGYRLGAANDAIVQYRLVAGSNHKKSFRIGREGVRLHRDFRRHGHMGPSVGPIKAWGWLLATSPLLFFSANHRDRWLRVAARRCGYVVGSIKYRHLVL